jgi:UV DNA damage endonuclease
MPRPACIAEADALSAALDTWSPGVTPKIHYSSPRLDVEQRRVVSEGISSAAGCCRRCAPTPTWSSRAGRAPAPRDRARAGLDVMLEAKAKDLALLRLRAQLAEGGLPTRAGRVNA